MRSLQQMHSWGLCPRPGSVFPFPWASKLVREMSKGQDSGVLEVMAGGRAAVLAQGRKAGRSSGSSLFIG